MPITREHLAEEHPDLLFCDGLDHALIGVVSRFGMEAVALYDRALIIRGYMDDDGMTWEEASEFFDFNVIGAWVGPQTPAFADLGVSE